MSPATLAQRVKGRLDQAIRQANLTLPFSKTLAVRSLGESRCADVERYIQEQTSGERFVDTGFDQNLKSYTVVNSNIDLVVPTASARGRYWYNLHIALVTAGRQRITNVLQMCLLRDTCDQIAAKMGHSISSLVLMPDHLHITLRGNIEHSPTDIGRCLQNDLAYAVGNHRLWADGFYVGSFGEYGMDDVRQRSQPNRSYHLGEFDAAVAKDVGPHD
jgi:REP element-mobilizing transposase RayT